ncbi:hypothetical protein JTE90_014633 [Oedothorax gibbosus]|uniref:PDZ domain-containing protein n=1 Tax=Oedothorax gibbosus TaxID=931172 RepID=A0AAV6V9J3_9ARAC|nr:hypothetical protein JTE90_014633 [Oedothorax gibbosus]
MAFEHQPGMAIECLSIPIKLTKETVVDAQGREVQNCGFKIGGGIDQDFHKSPQGYKDSGIYVTEVYENSPAQRCGLKIHDKILQVLPYKNNKLRKGAPHTAKVFSSLFNTHLKPNFSLTKPISPEVNFYFPTLPTDGALYPPPKPPTLSNLRGQNKPTLQCRSAFRQFAE